jgi:2,5-diketo-D-gluconate reductase A
LAQKAETSQAAIRGGRNPDRGARFVTTSPTITLNDGVQIPQLGFGVYQISTDDIVPALTKAIEVGYRHIDTAALYGNEEGVGRVVRDCGVTREDFFVTTKCWNSDQGYDEALAAFDASLDRLGLDYVDLYLIHWPQPKRDRYLDTWRAFEKIQADGRARSIGVSNFSAEHLRRLVAESSAVPAVNQIEAHPTFAQSELRAVHHELGIATEAWAPLGQSEDLDNPTVTRIAEQVGKSPAQVVLRWHLQLGNIVFPKSVTPERIEANFDVFDFELSASDMADIDAVDAGNRLGPDPDTFNS